MFCFNVLCMFHAMVNLTPLCSDLGIQRTQPRVRNTSHASSSPKRRSQQLWAAGCEQWESQA
jgi:hypothetical protein